MKTVRACALAAVLAAACAALAEEGKPPMNAPPKPNRLAHARSPYLLQHGDNPVDWYPWGEEAFEKARKEGKPIFLSVGYSACHWCHVMEHESFEDEETARFLNERFVSIKVDREERPDVDETYMRVTQMLTGHGGWPMSVFLTPEKKPFFAGTYFPKAPRPGMTTFRRLLEKIDEAWRTRRDEVVKSADEIARGAAEAERGGGARVDGPISGRGLVPALVGILGRRFDDEHGGFGEAPKFPPHQALRLFLEEKDAGEEARKMALFTLEKMAAGGIHDHVGGGFARYSTDEAWHVPHFEKMLYDNAMMARYYVEAHALDRDARWRDVAEGIFRWVEREMTDAAGGFYSALDADSEGVEGKFYLWAPDEVKAVLGAEEGERFCRAYDVTPRGNWEHGKSIPRLTLSSADPKPFAAAREKLYAARAKRVWPGLDDKVLVAWNGMMIGALARGSEVLGDPRLRAAAEKAARFILAKMRDDKGRLLRAWRKGDAGVRAYLEDHACLADGLLDLHAVTREKEWLGAARALGDALLADYEDAAAGGFFHTAHDAEELLFRSKDPFDGATPSGNGVAARALVRLGQATGEARYTDAADRALRAFAGAIQKAPHGTATLIGALSLRGEVPPAPAARSLGPVTAAASIEGTAQAGGTVTALLALEIAEPFHLAAPLGPIAVTSRDIPIEAGPAVLPAPVQAKLAFEDAPASIYRGRVTVRIPVRVKPHAVVGRGRLRFALEVRACDDRQCLPATELSVEVEVEVIP